MSKTMYVFAINSQTEHFDNDLIDSADEQKNLGRGKDDTNHERTAGTAHGCCRRFEPTALPS